MLHGTFPLAVYFTYETMVLEDGMGVGQSPSLPPGIYVFQTGALQREACFGVGWEYGGGGRGNWAARLVIRVESQSIADSFSCLWR